jgi:hypothetical protein
MKMEARSPSTLGVTHQDDALTLLTGLYSGVAAKRAVNPHVYAYLLSS